MFVGCSKKIGAKDGDSAILVSSHVVEAPFRHPPRQFRAVGRVDAQEARPPPWPPLPLQVVLVVLNSAGRLREGRGQRAAAAGLAAGAAAGRAAPAAESGEAVVEDAAEGGGREAAESPPLPLDPVRLEQVGLLLLLLLVGGAGRGGVACDRLAVGGVFFAAGAAPGAYALAPQVV